MDIARRMQAAIAISPRLQHEIAKEVGIAPRTLSRWGNHGLPVDWRAEQTPEEFIENLAAACGVTAKWFYADFSDLGLMPAQAARATESRIMRLLRDRADRP